MTVSSILPDWAQRAAALCDELVAVGKLSSQSWQSAVREVPRHQFVPYYYVYRDGGMTRIDPSGRHRAEWADTVYSNTALVTQIAPGPIPVFLSSSSAPGLMTRMLESLDIRTGMRVLEIGTGTGYNAALLCHRLGAENVCSIDIEPDLVAAASSRLAELGYRPVLVSGDGADGVPRHAPFNRLIATCAVSAVPWPWIEQTTIGGRILTDIKIGLSAGNLVLLDRLDEYHAEGRFDSGQAAFMQLRHQPGFADETPSAHASEHDPANASSTMLDPRTPWTNPVTWFLAVLRIGPHFRLGYLGADPRCAPTSVILSTPNGSRCEVDILADADGSHSVREFGPTRLWQHVEYAHRLWQTHGEPSWSRLGLTVTSESQTIFVDDPAVVIAALPAAR